MEYSNLRCDAEAMNLSDFRRYWHEKLGALGDEFKRLEKELGTLYHISVEMNRFGKQDTIPDF